MMILRRMCQVFNAKPKLAFKKLNTKCIEVSKINNNFLFEKLHTSTTDSVQFGVKVEFARSTLANVENYDFLSISSEPKDDVDITQVESLLEEDWSNMNNPEILSNFKILSYYALKNNECFYDPKYKKMVETLSSQCHKFSTKELLDLLNYLILWNDRNNKQIPTHFWNIFNTELFAHKKEWTIEDLLFINNNIFKLQRLTYSPFSIYSIKKLSGKNKSLSRIQMIQLMFYISILPKVTINMYNLENRLEKLVDNLSMNEIAIFSMAFSKYNNTIKCVDLNEKILTKLIDQIFVIDDIFLPELLKMLRINDTKLTNLAYSILKSLEPQVPKRSLNVLINILEFEKSSLIHNKTLTLEILKRLEPEIQNLTFKDITSLVTTLTSLNYNPETTSIYSVIINDLLKRCPNNSIGFNRIIRNLAVVNYYNKEAIKLAMNLNNLSKNTKYYMRPFQLFLNCSIKIDCPEYTNTNSEIKDTFYTPYTKFKNHINALRSDIANVCKRIIGFEEAVYVDIILPHFGVEYIIICYDEKTKQFCSPRETLSKFQINEIKYAPADGRKWYALISCLNAFKFKISNTFTGDLVMQLRHLERIGYIPISIFCDDWNNLDENEKETFISKILGI